MADQNNITLRSDKTSFLLFEEMDLNLLELKELITEFNSFVGTIFANHVSDFNQLVLDFGQFQTDVANEFLTTAKLSGANTFTNNNVFQGVVQLTGNTTIDAVDISSGNINNTAIGSSIPSSANVTSLESTSITSTGNILFHNADLLRMPIWTTLTRPTGISSTIGFNADLGEFEGHNGVEWASVGGSRIVQDAATVTPLYPVFVDTTSGTAKEISVNDTKLTYTPASSAMKTGWFITPKAITENITIEAGMTTVTGDRSIAIGTTVTIEPNGQWKIA